MSKRWKRGYLYGFIPVDVLVESTPKEDLRDVGSTIAALFLIGFGVLIILFLMGQGVI